MGRYRWVIDIADVTTKPHGDTPPMSGDTYPSPGQLPGLARIGGRDGEDTPAGTVPLVRALGCVGEETTQGDEASGGEGAGRAGTGRITVMGRLTYQVPAGTDLGRNRQRERRVAQTDMNVDVVIDDHAIRVLVIKAARSKGGRSVSGPVTARVRKG